MDTASDIREFLISRRAKLTPQQAGLPRIRLLEQENEILRRAAAYLSQASLPK